MDGRLSIQSFSFDQRYKPYNKEEFILVSSWLSTTFKYYFPIILLVYNIGFHNYCIEFISKFWSCKQLASSDNRSIGFCGYAIFIIRKMFHKREYVLLLYSILNYWLIFLAKKASSITAREVRCTQLSMAFFDRLETLGVVRGNGHLAKCLDTPVGDFIVADKLREV